MIIIKIMGGFASQVYKFFFGAKMAEYLHTELILDVSDYYDGYFRPYSLYLLNLPVFQTICTREIEKKYSHLIMVRNSDDMERMINNRRKSDYYIFREETDYAEFFWRHPEFEVDASTPYIKTLKLKKTSEFIESFVKEITQHVSVAIHIRRGDFVTLGQESKSTYFRAAVAWFYERNPNTQFYFFSNDLEWAKEQFGYNRQFHYVHAPDKKLGDIEELFCISYCNYRILSSYSSYGLLANTLAAVRNEGGFALLEEKKSEEYEYKGIEGSIRYLENRQIAEYAEKYDDILWEGQEGELTSKENAVEPLQKEMEGNGKEFFVVTCERYSKWFRRGMFEIAVRLAEKGYKVNYINLWDCLGLEEIGTEAACNMDGEEYGFDIIRGSFEQIIREMKYKMIICDCKLPVLCSKQPVYIKSHRAEIMQKQWSQKLLRSEFLNGVKYIVSARQDIHCTITLLDEYWESTLMKSGNSDNDIMKIFDQVYERVVEEITENEDKIGRG